MIIRKPIYLFQILIPFVLLFGACRHNCKIDLNPRLPLAKNTVSDSDYDSSLFSIEVRDSLMLISDYYECKIVQDFDELENFICTEIHNNHINPDCNYPVRLLIDSLTPFFVIDELIEELKIIGFQAAYFKTSKYGYFLVFPFKEEIPQSIVADIYGSRFASVKKTISECKNDIKKESFDSDTIPPPPPPPTFLSEFLYTKLYTSDSIKYPKMGIIEITKNSYFINGKEYSNYDFNRIIYNKQTLIIKLGKNNTYSDLINIVDLINGLQSLKYDQFSLIVYNKKYSSLDKDQSRSIRQIYGYRYLILNYAHQVYFENYPKRKYFKEVN